MGDREDSALLRREVDVLAKRVADLEELLFEFAGPLRKYTEKKSKTGDLFVMASGPSAESEARKTVSDALVARFEAVTGRKYVFEGAKDAAAVKALAALKPGLLGDLLARWEECLRMKSYPGTTSLAIFRQRINSFGQKNVPVVEVPIGKDPYAAT